MNLAIKIDGVEKIYPRTWRRPPKRALAGVSLDIEAGETFGFIGQNGAGKSTLIKILVGVLLPTRGSVSVFDRSTSDPASRRGLGFVPENPSLPESLTPLEILLMSLRLHQTPLENPRRHCMEWLARFDLSAVANAPLRGFSKGMMQRTALAHALAIQPRLLILDEPLSGLDPVGRKDVVDILDEYRRGGGTLFFSSHVLHDVERIADRFGLIHRGELLTIRSPSELAVGQATSYKLRYWKPTNAGQSSQSMSVDDVAPGDLPSLIARVQKDGGIVQDVSPSVSLEAVFFRTIRDRDGVSA